jgi:hypothetical protein
MERRSLTEAVRLACNRQDIVGSFNYYNGRMWGSFLLKMRSCEEDLLQVEKDFGIQFTYLD